MSRSRYYGHGHPRRWDPWDDVRPRIDRTLMHEDIVAGEREYADHLVDLGAELRLEYDTERARILIEWDARLVHHRGRRRSKKERHDRNTLRAALARRKLGYSLWQKPDGGYSWVHRKLGDGIPRMMGYTKVCD